MEIMGISHTKVRGYTGYHDKGTIYYVEAGLSQLATLTVNNSRRSGPLWYTRETHAIHARTVPRERRVFGFVSRDVQKAETFTLF